MAERQNSPNSVDNNVLDADTEFEFNPLEWMVLDDGDDDEDENGNAVSNSLPVETGNGMKDVKKQQQSSSSTSTEGKTQSKSSVSKRENIRTEGVKNTGTKKTSKSPLKDTKAVDKEPLSKSSGSKAQVSNSRSHQKSLSQTHGSNTGKGNTVSGIADVFDKMPSIQNKVGRMAKPTTTSVVDSKAGSVITTNSKNTAKRKAEDDVKSSTPTKVTKHGTSEGSKESSTATKSAIPSTTSTPLPVSSSSSSVAKASNQRTNQTTSAKFGSKTVAETRMGSTKAGNAQLHNKKMAADLDTTENQQHSAGLSIAEAMGVKISESSTSNIVDDKDVILLAVEKKTGNKKTSDEGSTSIKHSIKTSDAKLAAGTASSAISVCSQNSIKDVTATVNTPTNTPSATPGVMKKRIIRRFHRTTQTLSSQVSNKLLQCLIKIPSLDWPKKPSCCDIGLMADTGVANGQVSALALSVQSAALKADSVAEDVFKEALSFGMAEDGIVSRKQIEDYGIRFCKILSTDTEKANANIKKADGYGLSFPSKNCGTLDLFYHAEDGLVQMYNYFRKNRLGTRYVCMSILKPPTTPDKKDKTAQPMLGVSAMVVFDQNYANSAYTAYNKASSWMKPKADVFVSVHNVPKDVPLSLFTLIFPDAVSVELDNPSIKVTQDTSNRVKLGMPRKVVDNFLNLFSQVFVNNTRLVFSSGLTREEDVPEMKEIIVERKKMADKAKLEPDDKKYPTLTGVARDINAKNQPKKNVSVEPEVIMQVEDVESIEKVLTGRAGAWKGPSTPDSLRQRKSSSSKEVRKSRPRSSAMAPLTRDELSDISDDSDIGGEVHQKRRCGVTAKDLQKGTNSPIVLNRWRQTEPLNVPRMERNERDYSRKDSSRHSDDADERFVDLRGRDYKQQQQQQRQQQPPFSSHENPDRNDSGREVLGRKREEKAQGDGDRNIKWPDLNDSNFDRSHKVIVASRHRSDHSRGGSGGQISDGEEDLRCMLEDLKSRRSSRASERVDVSSVNRRNVEFGGRPGSPSEADRSRSGRGDIRRSPNTDRLERDRRVVSRNPGSSTPPRRRGRSPSPFVPRHRVDSREREQPESRAIRSSLSPSSSGRRGRHQSPTLPVRRVSNRRTPSPPLRSRQQQQQQQHPHSQRSKSRDRDRLPKRSLSPSSRKRLLSPRSRELVQKRSMSPRGRELVQKRSMSPRVRERQQKRSLSPILPFRPGQRSSNIETKESGQDSMRFRQSAPDTNKLSMREKSRSSRERNVDNRKGLSGPNRDIAMSKNLYNRLMDGLRQKADVFKQSNDRNLMDAASVYSQINNLAETLTAIKNDEEAVKQFGMNLDELDALVQHSPKNSKNTGTDGSSSGELHPDLLRYVNVKPGSGNAGMMGNASESTPGPSLPPPIPPPVAPPLFTSDSPTDKKAQLEAIAKQLVSDLKRQGLGGGNNSGGSDFQGDGRVGGGEGTGVSGGMWMVPPPTSGADGGFSGPPMPPQSMMRPMGGVGGGDIRAGGPPMMPGSLFSMPPPPVIPNIMQQQRGPLPGVPPMNLMNMARMPNMPPPPGNFNNGCRPS